MKPQILLIGRLNEELIRMHQEIADFGSWDVVAVSTSGAALDRIRSSPIDLLVFNLDSFSKEKIKLATDLRQIGYPFPVLVLAEKVSREVRLEMSNSPNTILVDKPYVKRTLLGLVTKLILGKEVKQQIAPRRITKERANIESFRGGKILKSRLSNLSETGAFIEYNEGSLAVGDILKMEVELDSLNKTHVMTGQVVWTARDPAGVYSAGIRFLGAGDVYRLLLQEV